MPCRAFVEAVWLPAEAIGGNLAIANEFANKSVGILQVIQSKKRLLTSLHSEVAGKEDGSLKRMLGEDEGTMQRREQCHQRLRLLQQASEELSAVSF